MSLLIGNVARGIQNVYVAARTLTGNGTMTASISWEEQF